MDTIWDETVEAVPQVLVPPPPIPPSNPPIGDTGPLISWGIDHDLGLQATCADFYLQIWLDLMGVEGAEEKLASHVEYLENQFARYTDMVVGGELRHVRRYKKLGALPKPLRQVFKDGLLPASPRPVAWEGWRAVRQRHGTVAIRWAVETFNLDGWGGGYGGPKWAKIAETLLMREVGIYSPTTFIDTCFGMEHNNGSYFNKVWTTYGLSDVLDAKQRGDVECLAGYASASVSKSYRQHIGEEE